VPQTPNAEGPIRPTPRAPASRPPAEELSGAVGRLDELRRAVRLALVRGWEDNVPQMAGSLAFTLVFAIFPALMSAVAVLDLTGRFKPIIEDMVQAIGKEPTDSPWRALKDPLEGILNGGAPAWPLLIFGVVITIWTAGNYIGGYQWAVGRMRREPVGRSFLRQRAVQMVLAIIAFLLVMVAAIATVVTGPVAAHLGDAAGAGETTRVLWSWLRWPALFLFVAVLFAVFYQVGPGARREGFGLFTTGSVVAILGWLVSTAGFSVYVKYFADYNRVYGTLGAFIAFLTWLYLFNVALLASTEIDAALEDVTGGADAGEATRDDERIDGD